MKHIIAVFILALLLLQGCKQQYEQPDKLTPEEKTDAFCDDLQIHIREYYATKDGMFCVESTQTDVVKATLTFEDGTTETVKINVARNECNNEDFYKRTKSIRVASIRCPDVTDEWTFKEYSY